LSYRLCIIGPKGAIQIRYYYYYYYLKTTDNFIDAHMLTIRCLK